MAEGVKSAESWRHQVGLLFNGLSMTPKSVLGRHLSGWDRQNSIHIGSIMDAHCEELDAENFDYHACCKITGAATDRVYEVLKEFGRGSCETWSWQISL